MKLPRLSTWRHFLSPKLDEDVPVRFTAVKLTIASTVSVNLYNELARVSEIVAHWKIRVNNENHIDKLRIYMIHKLINNPAF